MEVMNAETETMEQNMDRSTNYTACTLPLMRRCCMGAHAGSAGISSFHTVVNADFVAQQQFVARRNWVPQSGLTSQMWDHQTVTVNRKWCMRQANH